MIIQTKPVFLSTHDAIHYAILLEKQKAITGLTDPYCHTWSHKTRVPKNNIQYIV